MKEQYFHTYEIKKGSRKSNEDLFDEENQDGAPDDSADHCVGIFKGHITIMNEHEKEKWDSLKPTLDKEFVKSLENSEFLIE